MYFLYTITFIRIVIVTIAITVIVTVIVTVTITIAFTVTITIVCASSISKKICSYLMVILKRISDFINSIY